MSLQCRDVRVVVAGPGRYEAAGRGLSLRIIGMGVAATLAAFRARWIVIGARLFILSDSMIAVGKFKSPFEYSHYLIWTTYYVGQLCIAVGFIRDENRSRSVKMEERMSDSNDRNQSSRGAMCLSSLRAQRLSLF